MNQVEEREAGVACLHCGAHAERVFLFPSSVYVKHTYVGDVWDRNKTEPVRPGTTQADANKERVRKMRKKNAD